VDKKLAERLKKVTPEGGMFDVSFNTGNSPVRDTVATTVILTLVNKAVDGKPGSVANRITLMATHAKGIAQAQKEALNQALLLLGV
jgi:hypothetical protein